jgi:hypothetical protein
LRKIIDLASSGGKRVLDRDLDMFVPGVLGWCVIDDNIFVRRKCKPDVDMEAGAVLVLVAMPRRLQLRGYDRGLMVGMTRLWPSLLGFPWDTAPRYLIRDRDGIYGAIVGRRLPAMCESASNLHPTLHGR